MRSFGLVTEGHTDQVVIENILIGIFKDPDLFVNRLQPVPDEPGNWDKVFKYCGSEEFREAFAFNDFIIIQVDTDVLIGGEIPKKYNLKLSADQSIDEIIDSTSEFLISLITREDEFYEEFKERIIFGISVHQLECWLLPIYYQNKKTTSAKITGCLDTLNRVLKQKEGFYIDAKDWRFYVKISKHFKKKIYQLYHLNPSLEKFVENIIEAKRISEEEE